MELWNIEKEKLLFTIPATESIPVFGITYDGVSNNLISISYNGTLKKWNIE
jgi:WD40 repeat protein